MTKTGKPIFGQPSRETTIYFNWTLTRDVVRDYIALDGTVFGKELVGRIPTDTKGFPFAIVLKEDFFIEPLSVFADNAGCPECIRIRNDHTTDSRFSSTLFPLEFIEKIEEVDTRGFQKRK